MITVTSTLTMPGLDTLAHELEERASKVVRKTAFDVEADAKLRAPVDTGFLRSSIYAGTDQGSDYGAGGGHRPLLPEIKRPPGISAVVAVGAAYGVYPEYGTHRMGAQPFFTPAVERARIAFVAAMRQVLES